MENAVDALKIAFAMFIFVLSLSIAFMAFSQAMQTSNKMLFASDPTNYYSYSGTVNDGGRIVNSDVVISTLYRYYKESIVVIIQNNAGTEKGRFDTAIDTGSNTIEKKKEKIRTFINETLDKNKQYLETFDEVKKSGKYVAGEDGTTLTTISGQTIIYITYREVY